MYDPHILASVILATLGSMFAAVAFVAMRNAIAAAHRAARAAGLANAERVAAWNAHDNAASLKLDTYSLACYAKRHAIDAEQSSRDALNSRSKAHAAAMSCTADAARADDSAKAAASTLAAIESAKAKDTETAPPRHHLRIVLPFPASLESASRTPKRGKPDPAPWNQTTGETGA